MLKKVYSLKKKQPKCNRNTTRTLREMNMTPPNIGDIIEYKKVKLKVTRVWHKPKCGVLVEYEGRDGDVGVCLVSHWFDKVQEEKDS